MEDLSLNLTKQLYMTHQKVQPITMNDLIASSLIFHPKSEISFKSIQISCKNLLNHIKLKNYQTYINNPPQNYDINEACLNLGFSVKGDPKDKHKGD